METPSRSVSPSIYLKAYQCQDGREIHYSVARLQRDGNNPTTILDMPDSEDVPKVCWVYFTPMGPNRRILEVLVNRYAQNFECDKEVLFLCINRPGKCGSSSSISKSKTDENTTDERKHIQTSCDDIISILNHYGIRKASLFYMCAGSTFAYSFATRYPERTTGYIIGIASWVLRSDSSSQDIQTPQKMNSLTHRLAMKGIFGPKWFVSNLVGGMVGSTSTLFSSIPSSWIVEKIKKEMSNNEVQQFDEQFPDEELFVKLMIWIHMDGRDDDDETSVFVNAKEDKEAMHSTGCFGNAQIESGSNNKDGDAKDIAVCLSSQQDIGLVYKTTIPQQKQVLLWHGEHDQMISVTGGEYLQSTISNATLTRIPRGTHQGVMFFFPNDVMEALNRISRDAPV